MAQPTNLYDTYDTTGIREDLVDVIYNISPEDTPILSAIPRTIAKQTKHEWQLDALAAPASNAVIEGDDATIDAMSATSRDSNFTQIMDKVIAVSGTQSSVDAAGRADEMAYQIAKKSKELKKDMELALSSATLAAVGSATAARTFGGLQCWIKTNGSAGTSGSLSTGAGTDAPGAGTNRALTEAILKTTIEEVYTAGGDLDVLVVPPKVKQTISGFIGTTSTPRFSNSGDRTFDAAIDVYASDFGSLQIVPNRVWLD
tara:strand:- start:883 stop:1656 length:774 start_codon:yes stop_codon:yes gene_type:complete